jgi:predicted ester cyclase
MIGKKSLVAGMCCTALAATIAAAGCKKEEAPPAPAMEPKPVEPPKPAEPPPPKPFTAEEQVKWYQDCWGKFNAKDFDGFKKCFGPDATAELVDSGMPPFKGADATMGAQMFAKAFPDLKGDPQLVLQNGKTTLGVWLLTGTNSGPMPGPGGAEMPATNKKIGLLAAHLITVGDSNMVATERMFLDQGELASQLGVSKMPGRPVMDKGAASATVVIAKDDDTEKKNLETEKASIDAWNKHDVKAVAPFYADDSKFSESAEAKDQSKKEMIGNLGDLFKAMSDVKLDGTESWAAGDYVVTTGMFTGTNDGPMMKMKPTGKKVSTAYIQVDRFEGGKIKESWLFYNSMAMAMQLGLVPAPGAAPAAGDKGAAAPAGKGDKKEAAPPKGAQ